MYLGIPPKEKEREHILVGGIYLLRAYLLSVSSIRAVLCSKKYLTCPDSFNPSDWERVYKFAREVPDENLKSLAKDSRQNYELIKSEIVKNLRF